MVGQRAETATQQFGYCRIAHMREGEMLSFRIAWNMLCGIPMIMPSHFYENHIDHHNSHHYGTERHVTKGARNLFIWAPLDAIWLNHNWHQTHHEHLTLKRRRPTSPP